MRQLASTLNRVAAQGGSHSRLADSFNVELRRFVQPLRRRLRTANPHVPWHWGPTEQASFNTLNWRLTTAPVLRTFDSGRRGRRSVVTTNASKVAISAVLTQPDDDGHHHPVAYESRKQTAAEQAYPNL